MNIDARSMVSISEANRNFARVARLVDDFGSAVILKNNTPRYLIVQFAGQDDQAVQDEDVLAASRRFMERNKSAYGVLAE